MNQSIYALLVGINEYDPASIPPVPSLKGCVNDIRAIEEYLRERTKGSGWTLVEPADRPWVLTDQNATRQAVIKGFEEHLCNAESDDVVFFYYAGHGAQEKAPEEFWDLEADHLDETLVCYDSRTPASRDLADKELAYLISKVAKKNPHVLVILDCCHSGSGTRDLSPDIGVRRGPVDSRDRPLSSFILSEEPTVLDQLLTSSRNLARKTTGVVLPKGKHVMFSACRDHELAKEYRGEDGQQRGAFSYFLLQTLHRTNGSITYRDLARNLNALLSGKVRDQSPQVEATDPEELNQPFLGGAIPERSFYFTLSFSGNDQSWVIDGGALHGIPKRSNAGDTLLAIFPAGSTPEQLRHLSDALGEAKVVQVLGQRSKVAVTSGSDRLSEDESYWVVVTSLPLAPLKVFIQADSGEEVGIELVRQALEKAGPNQQPSLFVSPVNDSMDADYRLITRNGQYWITQPGEERPLVAPIPEKPDQTGYTPEQAGQVVQRLEHIARWTNILELSSAATSRIKPDDLELEIIVLNGQEPSSPGQDTSQAIVSEKRLEYTEEDDTWMRPTVQVKLTNHSQKTIYCNLLNLSENFSVGIPFFEESSSVRLPSKASGENATIESFEIDLYIPDEFLEQGITEYKNIIKLIASTTDFDASLLEQPGLDLPSQNRAIGVHQGTLNQLMDRVYSRDAVRSTRGYVDDWMTKEVTITIVRPQDARQIKAEESLVLQQGAVEVQPHPSLQAKVNLTTIPQASRDLGNLILPPILRTDSRLTQSFQFTPSRGSDPGLSALELSDVKDYTVVTPEAPLKLLVDTTLGEDEHLLPLAHDGEFFLPLGWGVTTEQGKTEITLERLTRPAISSRSLQGSIRIFFQKIVSQKLGGPFEYPILASVEVRDDQTVIYEKNQDRVKEQVAQAQKIVLYIHGIIGDTQSMVPSIRLAKVEADGQERSLLDLYDLVLAFDYENLKTTIEENARLLGQRLAAVGLGPKHGKDLHIIAHSMGGLVSRWFIEREGGNQVVQHLVMLGTPNGGSPWPAVQDWAFIALGIGLNQLSAIVWPTKVVADLLAFLEANDNSLDQMQPDSPFIKAIAESPDPSIPYTIIAGDRSILPAAMQLQPAKQSSPLQRLVQKLFGGAVDKVVNLVFFKQPNDIAVTLASIKSVDSDRLPQPRILLPDSACDHLTYFTHQGGLEALAIALGEDLVIVSPPSQSSDKVQPLPQVTIPQDTTSPAASSTTPEQVNIMASTPDFDAVASVPKPEPNPVSASTHPPSAEPIEPDNDEQGVENRSGLNGTVVGVIALLVALAVIGLVVWKRSPKQEPQPQNTTSQPLPGEINASQGLQQLNHSES